MSLNLDFLNQLKVLNQIGFQAHQTKIARWLIGVFWQSFHYSEHHATVFEKEVEIWESKL